MNLSAGVVAVDLSATAVDAAKEFLSQSKSPAAAKVEVPFVLHEDSHTFSCA